MRTFALEAIRACHNCPIRRGQTVQELSWLSAKVSNISVSVIEFTCLAPLRAHMQNSPYATSARCIVYPNMFHSRRELLSAYLMQLRSALFSIGPGPWAPKQF